MPDTPKHPVTLGDLLTIGVDRVRRPATVADLKSACRALDWLVIEKVDGEWPKSAKATIHGWYVRFRRKETSDHPASDLLDALAEAQP